MVSKVHERIDQTALLDIRQSQKIRYAETDRIYAQAEETLQERGKT